MTIVVHHLNDSRSQRILWLLEELGLPYEIKKYQRTKQRLAPPELLAINPLGKSPVITDGDVTLAESGAIVEYLIGRYGNGKGQPTEAGKVDNLYFTHYAEGSLMPILVQNIVNKTVRSQSPFLLRPIVNLIFNQLDTMVHSNLKKHLDMIESHLAKSGNYFASDTEPTSADYLMVFPLEALAASAPEILGPKSKEYVQRIHARPAYAEALKRGGEYAFAKL
ncbi:GST N-terminal domain-containing protein [Pleurotus pulmonarius]